MKIPILETKILFMGLLKEFSPDMICDVGSLDASFSIKAASKAKNAKVIAFEANPENYSVIKSNPLVSKFHIDAHHYAVYNKNGMIDFFIADAESLDNKGTSSTGQKDGNYKSKVSVTSVRLDNFLSEKYSYANKIALWIDVEGAGYEVVEGIKGIKDKVLFLQVEVEEEEIWRGQKLSDEVIHFCINNGFTLIARGEGKVQYDLLFINQNISEKKCLKVLKKSLMICRFRKIGESIREWKRRYIYKSRVGVGPS